MPTDRRSSPLASISVARRIVQKIGCGDALNPHNIGRQRTGVYLRHLILVMAKNLLDWADHEFTLNNSESLKSGG